MEKEQNLTSVTAEVKLEKKEKHEGKSASVFSVGALFPSRCQVLLPLLEDGAPPPPFPNSATVLGKARR